MLSGRRRSSFVVRRSWFFVRGSSFFVWGWELVDSEGGVGFAAHFRPPAVQVLAKRAVTDAAQPVILADVFNGNYDDRFSFVSVQPLAISG